MSNIKNLFWSVVGITISGAAMVIGMHIGQSMLDNGLEDKIDEKTEKWFSK